MKATVRCVTCFNGAAALQRRRRVGAETAEEGYVGASMGPPLFSDGDLRLASMFRQSPTASMGPPLFSDGDEYPFAIAQSRNVSASMGPPLFSDGDVNFREVLKQLRLASMGPPLFSDGDRLRPWLMAAPSPCFNGAAALQRRRLGPWSRESSAMLAASMGPPLFSDGDFPIMFLAHLNKALQWGRRSSATETWKSGRQSQKMTACFNGAAALQRRRRDDGE